MTAKAFSGISTKTRLMAGIGVLSLGLAAFGNTSHAAGFFVQELSSSGAGSSYAGQAAMPRDASIIFHNPSGITHLEDRQINAAVHGLYVDTDVTDLGSTGGLPRFDEDGGNPGGFRAIPNFYFATPVTDDKNLWFGLAATTPFGLGVDYDQNFFGAFTAQKVELKTVDLTPTLSYQVNDWLSVGASAIIQYGDINFQQFTAAGDLVRVKGDDYAYGYKIGATLTPHEDWRIGLNYRSRVNQDFEGEINSVPSVPPSGINAGSASGTLNMPDIANLAVAYDLNDQWTVMGGVDWYGWNATDQVTIIPASGPNLPVNFAYENTLNFNLGAEYVHDDKWTFRGGYQFDETPTTIEGRSFVNPDGDRHWFSAGTTYNYTQDISIDLAASYLLIEDGNVDQDRAGGVNVLGEADNSAVIGTIGLNYKF